MDIFLSFLSLISLMAVIFFIFMWLVNLIRKNKVVHPYGKWPLISTVVLVVSLIGYQIVAPETPVTRLSIVNADSKPKTDANGHFDLKVQSSRHASVRYKISSGKYSRMKKIGKYYTAIISINKSDDNENVVVQASSPNHETTTKSIKIKNVSKEHLKFIKQEQAEKESRKKEKEEAESMKRDAESESQARRKAKAAEESKKAKAASAKKAAKNSSDINRAVKRSLDDEAALESATTYANDMHMSKAALYDQLTSQSGDKFTPEAAQYAVDHVKTNWNRNALESAKTYQQDMHLSSAEIQDQLTSESGDRFTPAQAAYAIAHLGE